MTSLLRRLARWIVPAALCASSPAWAILACSITAMPSPVTGIYAATANRDIAGSFTVTCTRNPNSDDRRPYIWIGVDQPAGGQTMPRDIGGATLSYFIYRRNFGQGVWLNSGEQSATSNNAGALRVRLDFGNNGAALTQTFNFYYRIPSGQNRPAGVYLDAPVAVTLREDDQAGRLLGTTSIASRISIPRSCRFSMDPAPVVVNYTAFNPAPIVSTTNFELVCTEGTNYTLALDAVQGNITSVGIKYQMALNASGAITGTALAQAYSVTVTIPAGQAGRCATASCSGSVSRTVVVTY